MSTTANSYHKAKILTYVGLLVMIIGSVGLDQLTKRVTEDNLLVWSNPTDLKEYEGRHIPVFTLGTPTTSGESPKLFLEFNLNYVRNQGAAWGALSNLQDSIRVPFFYLVTLLAVLVIFFYLRTTPLHHTLARFALALILSGAFGNFLDRLRLGYVVDFLDFHWVIPLPWTIDINLAGFVLNANAWRYNFPNFNWADSSITVGATFLIFDMLVLESLRKKKNCSDNIAANSPRNQPC